MSMWEGSRWIWALSFCFVGLLPQLACSEEATQDLAADEEQLAQTIREQEDGVGSFLSEWVVGEEDVLLVKAILFLRKDLWTLWVNDREFESPTREPSEGHSSAIGPQPTQHLHIPVGNFDVEILAVQPKLITARCQNRTFSVRVGKQCHLTTELASIQKTSVQR